MSGGGGDDGGWAGSYGIGAAGVSAVAEVEVEEVVWTASLAGVTLAPFVECDAEPLVDGVASVWARGSSVGMLTVRPGQPDGPSA